jgi:hypothetical protein
MKKTFVKIGILAATLIVFLTSGDIDSSAIKNTAFKPGEFISYNIFYNLGFIWINAGDVNLSVGEVNYKKKPAYRFYIAGSTRSSFDHLYKVRDTLMSIADQGTLLPYYFKRMTHEDSYWAQDEFFFTETGKKTSLITDCRRKHNNRNVDTLAFNKTVTDLITVLYRVRNIDYNKLQINQKQPFSIVFDDDDKEFNLNFKYVGKGEVELRNGKKYRCLKLQPLLIKGQVFKEENGMTIYLSDDQNRVPIMIESKIRVGSIKCMLTNAINTLYPLSCEIK